MITLLDLMLKQSLGVATGQCPWTSRCGFILGIEPNGNTYNCSEFADLDSDEYMFGNVFRQTGV